MAELVTIARPYADALFELGQSAKTTDDWSIDLEFLLASYRTEEMQNFLKNPKTTNRNVQSVFDSIMDGRVSDEAKNFMQLVIKNQRLQVLPLITEIYEKLKADAKGKVDVAIYSAFDLEADEVDRVVSIVAKKINKLVNPIVKIEKDLIGGIKVEIGDKVWDLSINGKLKSMNFNLSK